MTEVTLHEDGTFLGLSRGGDQARFHAIWLRDNAWDATTRSPANGQRLIALRDIPNDTRIAAAQCSPTHLTVTFSPENKEITYDLDWLWAHRYDQIPDRTPGWLAPDRQVWDSRLSGDLPSADLSDLTASPAALRGWLEQITPTALQNSPVARSPKARCFRWSICSAMYGKPIMAASSR